MVLGKLQVKLQGENGGVAESKRSWRRVALSPEETIGWTVRTVSPDTAFFFGLLIEKSQDVAEVAGG